MMLSAVDPALGTIIVAAIGALTAIATILIQAKVHRDNRADHQMTAEVAAEIRDELRDLKGDVRALRADQLEHSRRITRVERVVIDTVNTLTPED